MRYCLVLIASMLFVNAAHSANSDKVMGAPGLLATYNHRINLLFPSIECASIYRIEVSLDKRHWQTVREGDFPTMGTEPETRCMRDFIDHKTRITKKTKAVYYRYSEIEDGKIIRTSEIGTVTAGELESYWDKE